MDFRFTEDQLDLIDAAKTVFAGENTVARMRAMAAGEPTTDFWQQIAELGLLTVMVPENQGGLGQPLVVMAAIAEAAGYAGIAEPYVEVAGLSLALSGRGDIQRQLSNNAKWVPSSTLRPYMDATNGLIMGEVVHAIDPLRKLIKDPTATKPGPEALLFHGAVLSAAQLVGLSQRMVDMSVEYAKDRQQFGKPIGAFQAIKHHLANVYTQIEFTRPMVHLAAIQGGRAVHTAKLAAIDTAMLAAETAIQVHGGMGYTYEVDLHLFMKRAWALCGEWGDRNYHMKKLEDLILNGDEIIGAGTTFK